MRNRGLGAWVALLFAAVALFSAPALAQQTGDLEGTVLDSNNAPLPGVAVEIKSSSLLGTRSTVTDSGGRYRFPAIPPGNYSVTATLSGFTKAEKTNVRVSLGAAASIPITLSVGKTEELVITGEAPVVDITKNVVGTSTSIDTIQKLPLGRNYTAIATTVGGTGGDGTGVTVYGATGLENQYIIDGVNTTGIKIGDVGKTLNNEFVQEVEVKTGGYEAEYSRALGGVINVVTKSGGNEFHGDLFGYNDSPSTSAKDAHACNTNPANGPVETCDKSIVNQGGLVLPKRLDIGADLGGYFLKDRLWFFGAYDRVNLDQDTSVGTARSYSTTSSTVTTTNEARVDERRSNLFSGKLTFRLGESNTIAVAAFGDPGTFTGVTSNVVGPDSARNGTIDFGGTDISAKWDGIFGTQFLAQGQYGYHEDKSVTNPASTALSVRDSRRSLTTYAPGSGQAFYTQEKYRRSAGKVSGTAFFGSNEVKVGVDYESLNSSFFEAYGGGALITNLRLSCASPASAGCAGSTSLPSGSPFRYAAQRYFARVPPLNCVGRVDASGNIVTGNFGTPGPGNALVPSVQDCLGYTPANAVENPPSTKNVGLFAQDSFKVVKNLTINVGIRYDNQSLKNAEGDTLIKLTNEWSPRVGLVWDFLNNGKSKFTASYGRYYEVIPQDIQTRALGNEYTTFGYNYSESTKDPITNPNIASYAYIQGGELTSDGLKGMYGDELIAGVEYEVYKGWSLGIKGIYKAIGRVVEDRCDLSDPRVKLSGYIPAGALTTCSLINPGEGDSTLTNIKDPLNPACVAADGSLTGPCESVHPRRYYRGLELDATHRFSNNFYMLASYVYSKLEGNYDGNLKENTGQADPNINADFDYVDLVSNSFGRLVNDRKHQFKISGTYSFPFGVSAGANFRYNSGAATSVNGYARPGYTTELNLIPRGTAGDLPGTYEMDLHLEYNLRLGSVTVTPIVDIFSLLNRQGLTSRSTTFNSLADGNRYGLNNRYNQPYVGVASIDNSRNNPAACQANPSYSNAACSTNVNYLKDNGWQGPRQFRIGGRVSF